ncbi:hypothetical protein B0A58_07335 [Flavobacterium branchiophilum NBRC 15030 = ATCC 35035]|uniref:Uncharacterized protein n=1 Tax=Flavobacterium branchiophilum TaxID=55197 RepID=A0A543G132_9FLAO|nr:hypothetical protein [Flavobacterium branchiophilum]OXA76378.1 hypothetical protein B0A58_07335 [Flavobacterium branchiophilum NBRC 15030 = ATCC 35035]TQM39800.1 hypothetical protein BC670_0631 [Flavobacterium branchiophilum]GEM55262.1 hypothetical protein FB1_14830 [Flavobacterium branchiophilum NBRC 15030 = ATCC 35035]
MKPIEVLHKKNATKPELRSALAESLGVQWNEPNQTKGDETPFKQCLNFFLSEYKIVTKLDYAFSPKHGIALKGILEKIEKVSTTGDVTATFTYLIKHLPTWYKENAFSLCVINSKFNEIIATIKTNKKISDGYKQQIITDIFR